MLRVISVVCALALVALAAPSVSAEPERPAKRSKAKKKKSDAKRAAKRSKRACRKGEIRGEDGTCTKSLIFGEGDDISGDTPTGYGEFMTATRGVFFGGLIRLRTNFHAEILKSADDI